MPPMSPAALNLALELTTAARMMRGGDELTPAYRRRLSAHLGKATAILTGRPAPAEQADPLDLVRLAIETARAAGAAPADVVTAVNDTLERTVAPVGR